MHNLAHTHLASATHNEGGGALRLTYPMASHNILLSDSVPCPHYLAVSILPTVVLNAQQTSCPSTQKPVNTRPWNHALERSEWGSGREQRHSTHYAVQVARRPHMANVFPRYTAASGERK